MKRYSMIVAILFAASLLVLPAAAADLKVGLFNSDAVLQELPEAQDALERFNEEIRELDRLVREKQEEFLALQQEMEQQANMFFSEEAKAKKQQELEQLYQEYRDLQRQSEQRAIQRNKDLFEPIHQKLQKAIDAIAEDEGYDLIFDTVGGGFAFYKDEMDMTQRLVEEMKKP